MRGQIVVPVLLRRGHGDGVKMPSIVPGDYIWYSYDPVTGYRVNADDGNVVIDQDTLSPNFDGKVSASNAVALPGDAYVDLDIVHQLGSELATSIMWSGATDNGDGTATVVIPADNIDTYLQIFVSDDTVVNGLCFIDIVSITGDDNIQLDYWFDGTTAHKYEDTYLTVGKNYFNAGGRVGAGKVTIFKKANTLETTIVYKTSVGDFSHKEISTNNSYLTYTDPVTQDIETIASQDNASASSKELIVNGDFSDGMNGWDTRQGTPSVENGILDTGLDGRVTQGNLDRDADKSFALLFETTEVVSLGGQYFIDGSTSIYIDSIGEYVLTKDGGFANDIVYIYARNNRSSVKTNYMSLKEVLPISTKYRMTNDFSNAVSHDTPFSQADLDLMRADPLTLMRVWFNGLVLPSGFAKVNMKHYYPANEGIASGAFIQDICVDLGAETVPNNEFDTDTDWYKQNGSTISGGIGRLIANGALSVSASNWSFRQNALGYSSESTIYVMIVRVKRVSGTGNFLAGFGWRQDIDTPVTSEYKDYTYIGIAKYDNVALGGMTIGDEFDIDWIMIKEISAVEIQNYTDACRTTYKNQRFGINNNRLLQDASGRATVIVDAHVARFNGTGSYIDSGIAVDGTLTDFTFMAAFTLPENMDSQYLANTSGTNRLYVHHEDGQPLENLRIGIGQNVFTMPPVDTNLKIHAMVAVYDHTTQEVMGAVDGEPIVSFGTIVFDGVTGKLIFGASNIAGNESFTGFLGEGMMTASKLDEAQWQAYWLRVKDIVPTQPMPTVTTTLHIT